MTTPVRRWRRRVLMLAAVAVAGIGLSWPVTTRQGVNYEVTAHRLPLYLKALEFVDRSAQYRQIADEVTGPAGGDEAKALAAYEWTRRRVRDVPEGFPIVDDHILNIITRGYGMADQQADVFATLCAYGGVPAFWTSVKPAGVDKGRVLTFVKIDGRWRVFDVAAGVVYRTDAGALATLEEVRGNPHLIPESVRMLDLGGRTYADVVSQLATPPVPSPLRAELQMPMKRLWHEMKATVGIESRHEPE